MLSSVIGWGLAGKSKHMTAAQTMQKILKVLKLEADRQLDSLRLKNNINIFRYFKVGTLPFCSK